MKGTNFIIAVLTLVAGISSEALARRGVPVQNYDNVPIVRADKAVLSSARVRAAIIRATQRNNWIVMEDAPNRIVATFSIKGKHSLTVDVGYSETQFSIDYRDSRNLNYERGTNGPIIHPAYNVEVKDLLDAINAELRYA